MGFFSGNPYAALSSRLMLTQKTLRYALRKQGIIAGAILVFYPHTEQYHAANLIEY